MLAVLVLRLLLKKAPKWITVLLWGVVSVRLVCPFSVESMLSLIPSAETVSPNVMTETVPQINSGIPAVNNVVNPLFTDALSPAPTDSINPLQIIIPVLACVWCAGMLVMLAYAAISFYRVRKSVGMAVCLCNNIYQSERVASPFVLGIFRPRIYLPFAISDQDRELVIAHERAHIQRRDHWWKPFGFLLLSVYWFNPLMWLSYVLLCRDIELACDEKVVKEFSNEQKADYSQALLTCSITHRRIAACPLAFGEVGVKKRVVSVLNYKKPAFWLVLAALLVSVVLAVCFLTDPPTNTLGRIEGWNLGTYTPNETAVGVYDGDVYNYVGPAEKALLTELYNLRVSKKEISKNRGSDRDKLHTLVLNLPDEPSMYSYVGGTNIHFNKDFTAVWLSNINELTLSYKVKNPAEAKSLFERITKITVADADAFSSAVSWGNYHKDEVFEAGALNAERLKFDGHYPVYRFDTADDLKQFKNAYGGVFTMERGWDEVPSFNDVTARYNEDFFENNSVILVYVTTGSCTYRYAVSGVEYTDTSFRVHIKETTNALMVDSMMAGWFVTVAVPDERLQKVTEFDAVQAGNVVNVVTTEEIERLRVQYPMYFDLSTVKGLEVYVWQMGGGSYSCGLLSGRNRNYTATELMALSEHPAKLDEMKAIVASYFPKISRGSVSVIPFQMPHSSFLSTIDQKELEAEFWEDFPVLQATSYTGIFDIASFDIDGDGVKEECTLRFGPTSGVFTFTFSCTENGVLEYSNVFVSPWQQLKFEVDGAGKGALIGNDFERINISIQNGRIVLSSNGADIDYWGAQGIYIPSDTGVSNTSTTPTRSDNMTTQTTTGKGTETTTSPTTTVFPTAKPVTTVQLTQPLTTVTTTIPTVAYNGPLKYEYDNGAVVITDCTQTSGSVVIPETINGYPVKEIGYKAFEKCTELTSVTIPSGVRSIGVYAFSYCKGLKSLTLPSSVTWIGEGAFHFCEGLESFVIPSGVSTIEDDVFYGCSRLKSITIPNGVRSIGGQSFYGCKSLSSVTLPNNLTYLGRMSFYGCTALTAVTVPNRVATIDFKAFADCTGLKSIVIPNSVTAIGSQVFEGCTGFQTITLPNSVTSIGVYAFSGCTGLTQMKLPSGLTTVEQGLFSGCTNLQSVTIPEGVTQISINAFRECASLKSLTLPSSVIRIRDSVFYQCKSLESIAIPQALKGVGNHAFSGCTALKTVYYGGSEADKRNLSRSIGMSGNYPLTSATWVYAKQ